MCYSIYDTMPEEGGERQQPSAGEAQARAAERLIDNVQRHEERIYNTYRVDRLQDEQALKTIIEREEAAQQPRLDRARQSLAEVYGEKPAVELTAEQKHCMAMGEIGTSVTKLR